MKWRFIIIILFLSLALRLYGINADLPNTYWHDENNYVETALRFGTGNLKPHTLQHGMLLPLILFAEYGAYYVKEKLTVDGYTPTDFLAEYVANPGPFYLLSRITVMLFGLGSILFVYLIAIKLYNKRVANISSLFFSFSLVPFIQSKWTKASAISVFFLLLALLTLIPIIANSRREKKSLLGRYVASGFFVGLASAAKLYSVFGFTFILLTHLFACRGNKERFFGRNLILSGTCLLLGFALGNPYAVVNPKFFLIGLTQMHGELFDATVTSPWLLYFKNHLKNVLGSRPLEVLILISCIFFVVKRSKKEMILLAYPVTLFLLYLRYSGLTHYLIPAVPFLVIIAGAFLDTVLKKASYSKAATFAVAVVIFVAVLPCFANILRYDVLISKPDTRTIAREWIEKNIPANSSILSEGYILTMPVQVPQLKSNTETLKRDLAMVREKGGRGALVGTEIEYAEKDKRNKRYDIYKTSIMDSDMLKKSKTDFVILSGYVEIDSGEREYLRGKDFYKERNKLYASLEEKYRLVKVFIPYPELGNNFPVLLTEDFRKLKSINPLRDTSRLLRGPKIKIYRRKNIQDDAK